MNYFKISIIILAFCCMTLGLSAQSPRAFEQAATAAFEVHDYYAAFKYYGKVLELEPGRTDIMVRYADAARLYGAFRDAELHYEAALNSDNSAAVKYHAALYGLAMVKKSLGKYDEAIQLFERYAARPDSDPDLAKKAAGEITECEWAMEKITNPDRLAELTPLDAVFNTGDSEMGIFQRGDTMYYSALHQVEWGDKHVPARPIFQVMMAWPGQSPKLADFNQPKKHTALPAIAEDGRIMVVPFGAYISETEIVCQLYISLKNNGVWSTPVPLPNTVNVPEYTQTQPHIATRADGYYDLYYVSDAPGGQGGKDIWRVQFSAAGNFGKPENLRSLNTKADEATPFFDEGTQTLYFSSTGYQNLGGYDIYKVKRENNEWQTVKHLPSPLNSSYNDLYYVAQSATSALLTSNRIGAAAQGEESCCYDLFSVTYKPLNLNLSAFETETETPLNQVVFSLLPKEEDARTKYSDEKNDVQFPIVREQQYVVLASKDGYFPDTANVSSLNLEPHKTELAAKLHLKPMQVDLAVKVFNQFSKEPLFGVDVFLYEKSGNVKDERNTGDANNESGLKADYRSGYVIIAKKSGFAPDTVEVSAAEMSKPGTKVIKNLFLTPASLYGLLPLAIYFDNDVPPRAPSAEIESYSLTYEAYMARKTEFAANFTAGITDEAEKEDAIARLEKFFEKDVKGGFFKLEYFADNLDLFLENGYEVEIMVKGFASPLASDDYNLALTRRRIVSVKNYIRAARNGIYESYLLDNQLKISIAPLGETAAAFGVNDNRRQRDKSIFSVDASKERRAEIIEVRLQRIHQ